MRDCIIIGFIDVPCVNEDELDNLLVTALTPAQALSDNVALTALSEPVVAKLTMLEEAVRELDACKIVSIPPDCEQDSVPEVDDCPAFELVPGETDI